MHNASGHNYWNSLFIMDVAMGQIPRSTERISSYYYLRTESFGQVLEVVLRENEVGQLRQAGDLLRQLFQLVLGDV